MSVCAYADRLNPRADVGGTLGEREVEHAPDVVETRARALAALLRASAESERARDGRTRWGCVAHTGAGISRAAGLPDFRGPDGIWTRRALGLPPLASEATLALAAPTATHQILRALVEAGYVRCVVSCNVDCLHLKGGLAREKLCELHGNVFAERCERCGSEYVRDFEMKTVGFKLTGRSCVVKGCGGRLRDQVLDWEDALPEAELKQAERESVNACVSICLGTSLQITPACNIPIKTKRKRRMPKNPEQNYVEDVRGKLVIVNLQPTNKDKMADMVIHAPCDKVMRLVATHLDLRIPPYERVDRVRVSHSCRANCSGSGFTFTLRIFNIHDENAPLPWLDQVVVDFKSTDPKMDSATLVKEPFKVKRVWNGDADNESISARLTFHFSRECTEAPCVEAYEVRYDKRGTFEDFSFVTMRRTYEDDAR